MPETPIFRYLDVCLVLATAPFVIAAGMPLLGYLVGAAAWLLTRLGAAALQARALRLGDPRTRAGLQVGVMLGRWRRDRGFPLRVAHVTNLLRSR